MAVASCGGLKFNRNDFHIVDGVFTTKTTTSVDDYFIGGYCGGIRFDANVFSQVLIENKKVVTLINEEPTAYIVANCSIMFDSDNFEINEKGELCAK